MSDKYPGEHPSGPVAEKLAKECGEMERLRCELKFSEDEVRRLAGRLENQLGQNEFLFARFCDVVDKERAMRAENERLSEELERMRKAAVEKALREVSRECGQGGELPKDAVAFERDEKETVSKLDARACEEAMAKLGARLEQIHRDGELARKRASIDGLEKDRRRLLAIVRDVANWSGHGNDVGGCVWERWSHDVKEALEKLPASVNGEADPTRRRWNTTLPSEVESKP